MTAPLLMTGPGGDYVNRFDVKGNTLVKTRTTQSAGHDRDAQSYGGGVAWGLLARRKHKKPQNAKADRTTRQADRFEHTEPAALPATYVKPAAADLRQQVAMIQAIEHWLTGQQDELDRLAAIQTATEASLAQAEAASAAGSAPQSAPAPVRVIRFNSKTMDLPTPAPSLTPEPCHAFANHEDNDHNDN